MTEQTPANNPAPAPETPSKNPWPKGLLIAGVLVGAGLAASYSLTGSADAIAKEKVDKIITKIEAESEGKLDIQYKSVSADLSDSAVVLEGVSFISPDMEPREGATIETLTLHQKGYEANVSLPESAGVEVDNLVIKDAEALARFKAKSGIDYVDRKIDAHASYAYTAGEDAGLSLSLGYGVAGRSELSMDLELSQMGDFWSQFQNIYKTVNSDKEPTQKDKRATMQALGQGVFEGFVLNYTNDGEIEELLAHAAVESGLTVEEMKERIPEALDRKIQDPALAKELTMFFSNPQTLSLTLQPAKKITLKEMPGLFFGAMMGHQDRVMEILNPVVKANQ